MSTAIIMIVLLVIAILSQIVSALILVRHFDSCVVDSKSPLVGSQKTFPSGVYHFDDAHEAKAVGRKDA